MKFLKRLIDNQEQRKEETIEFDGEEVPPGSWYDYRWQLQNSITSIYELQKYIPIAYEISPLMPIRITPYYLKIMLQHPRLQKTMIPQRVILSSGKEDPLGEEQQSPVSGLVHRYPDRVLLIATDFCYSNCQFCTRSRIINRGFIDRAHISIAIKYIQQHKEIRDVLISGGDPLTMNDDALEYVLQEVRNIPHVEIIRIGTKAPVVNPFRITDSLVSMLKKYHPLYMNIHFTHFAELTKDCCDALKLLANAGIPLGSQTVLLKDVNDDEYIIKELFQQLVKNRVKPYYLYACDQIIGNEHFRTDIQTGLRIMESLQGWTSGLCVPHFIIDAPDGGGKIPVTPNHTLGISENKIVLRNYKNQLYAYVW